MFLLIYSYFKQVMGVIKLIRILFINNVNVYIKCYLIPDNLMTLLSLPDFIKE